MDLAECDRHLTDAFRAYFYVKKNCAWEWHVHHNQSLVEALEAKWDKGSAAAIRARMKREKKQREMGRAARRIRQRNNKVGILKAMTTNNEGMRIWIYEEAELLEAMAESNRNRQDQCRPTPFLQEPLLES